MKEVKGEKATYCMVPFIYNVQKCEYKICCYRNKVYQCFPGLRGGKDGELWEFYLQWWKCSRISGDYVILWIYLKKLLTDFKLNNKCCAYELCINNNPPK